MPRRRRRRRRCCLWHLFRIDDFMRHFYCASAVRLVCRISMRVGFVDCLTRFAYGEHVPVGGDGWILLANFAVSPSAPLCPSLPLFGYEKSTMEYELDAVGFGDWILEFIRSSILRPPKRIFSRQTTNEKWWLCDDAVQFVFGDLFLFFFRWNWDVLCMKLLRIRWANA